MKDIVKLLEEAAIKALILGEGPLASLFSIAGSGAAGTAGIFGQLLKGFGFAEGGDIASGQWLTGPPVNSWIDLVLALQDPPTRFPRRRRRMRGR